MSAPPFGTDIVAGSALYIILTRTGTTTTDQIGVSDFMVACNRCIDRTGKTIMIRGIQYDLDTLAFQNQA